MVKMIQETKKIKSMTDAVIVVLDSYPRGHKFHGNQLHDDVGALFPKAQNMYTDTIMRMMRRHCSAQYKTVDQNNSLYEKV
jgi:hypothetical protein